MGSTPKSDKDINEGDVLLGFLISDVAHEVACIVHHLAVRVHLLVEVGRIILIHLISWVLMG